MKRGVPCWRGVPWRGVPWRGVPWRGVPARGSGAGFRVGTKSRNRHLKSASVFLDVVKRCLSFISSILSLPDSPGVRFYDVALDFS